MSYIFHLIFFANLCFIIFIASSTAHPFPRSRVGGVSHAHCLQRWFLLLGWIELVAVGTAKTEVLKFISESHSIVRVTLRADKGIAIVRTITNQIFNHLQLERERERER